MHSITWRDIAVIRVFGKLTEGRLYEDFSRNVNNAVKGTGIASVLPTAKPQKWTHYVLFCTELWHDYGPILRVLTMFDVVQEPFDLDILEASLAEMSDEDLARLEDDLDFCNFTGVPTQRVLAVLKNIVDLDAGWNRMLERKLDPVVPAAY